ncbi:MAG: hypothetical protein ACXABU_09020 [Candidatus Hodarchaeales archaeon]
MSKFTLVTILSLILSISSLNISAVILEDPEFEWKVSVGDSKTFVYKKYYNIFDTDGNGDPYSTNVTIANIDCDPVNITLKAGLKAKVEIIELEPIPKIQKTYDGILTPITDSLWIYVTHAMGKTVVNRTYWEDQSFQNVESDQFNNYTYAAYLDGDYFVESSEAVSKNLPGLSFKGILKRNWKTGWFTYYHYKRQNETHTLMELEISTKTSGIFFNLTLERNFLPIMFLFTLFTLVIIKKRRNH